MTSSVCVIGAGVGALVAIDLGRLGLNVTLIEERSTIFAGASASHMGRLHLGAHYSGDPFRPGFENTAQRCMSATLAWLLRYPDIVRGNARWWQFVTEDSMCEPDEYLAFCRDLVAHHEQIVSGDPSAKRLLGPAEDCVRILSSDVYRPHVAIDHVRLGVSTREQVIDQQALRGAVERDLTDLCNVDVRLSTRVLRVRAVEGGCFDIETADGASHGADFVVNCSWQDLWALGSHPGDNGPAMSTRLRFIAQGAMPGSLRTAPSMFFLRGALGNHTNLDGHMMRLASEPVCNLMTLPGVGVPEGWRRMMVNPSDRGAWADGLKEVLHLAQRSDGIVNDSPARRALTSDLEQVLGGRSDPNEIGQRAHDLIARAIVDGYANLVPAVVDSTVDVIPVVSVDMGSSDILDPAGAVHTRSWFTRFDERGVLAVYPGKLTFAAIAAQEAASLLAGSIGLRASEPGIAASDHQVT